jgi:hypothetical protein
MALEIVVQIAIVNTTQSGEDGTHGPLINALKQVALVAEEGDSVLNVWELAEARMSTLVSEMEAEVREQLATVKKNSIEV